MESEPHQFIKLQAEDLRGIRCLNQILDPHETPCPADTPSDTILLQSGVLPLLSWVCFQSMSVVLEIILQILDSDLHQLWFRQSPWSPCR